MLYVIDPGTRNPELGSFNKIASLTPFPSQIFFPALFPGKGGKIDIHIARGLIILGSSACVYDPLPWIAPLKELVLEAESKGVPILGICFGHQLLGDLFGGKVHFMKPELPDFKFKGTPKVTILKEDPIFKHLKTEFYATASHREEICQIPPTWIHLGSAPYSLNQVIRHPTKPIFGFQCHIEAEDDFISSSSIPLGESERETLNRKDHSTLLLKNFINQCRKPQNV